jgi:hypothetical protein
MGPYKRMCGQTGPGRVRQGLAREPGTARCPCSGDETPRRAVASQAAAADRARAAAWIAGQVSPEVTVACDAQMCGQIRGRGVPAATLRAVQPAASHPFGSGLVVATPAVRTRFGSRLAAVYAPLVIASFGTGAGPVDVRLVAPDGGAAFTSRLASGRATVISAARQLLGNRNLQASPRARAAMLADHVDSRLLVTFSLLAAQMPVRLVALGDLAPGASPAVPATLRRYRRRLTAGAGSGARVPAGPAGP